MHFLVSLLLSSFTFSSLAAAAAIPVSNDVQLKAFCETRNGILTEEWTCPLSGNVRDDGPFCQFEDAAGHLQVTNGCTGDYGVGSRFFKACVLHDFCYHNHGFLDGKTKASCDDKFLKNMYAICDQDADRDEDSHSACYSLAYDVLYKAVQYFGDKSWGCSNTQFAYPQSLKEVSH